MEGVKHIDFIGIGGIGMSSLARWAMAQGLSVSGYDKTPSTLIEALAHEGAAIRYSEAIEDWDVPADAWVVYTPAIPPRHAQLQAAKASHRTVLKRAELLGRIANSGRCLAVAGTHGKTTTSSMLAWMIYQAGVPVQAFLGGISSNLKSNFLPGPAEITVVEADEFDRSFLHLHPEVAAITSTDADHLDIYGEADHVRSAFSDFAHQCQTIYRSAQANIAGGSAYGLEDEGFRAEDIRTVDGRQVFTLVLGEERMEGITAGLPGLHNIENAVAAACLARHAGLSMAQIAKGISTFKGVQRRFERVFESDHQVFIDDYAHHPTEIKRLLQAVRSLYPERSVAVLFQPHLFSRTRDFLEGFKEELKGADVVGLLPIYPAREVALPGVTSEVLAQGIPGATVLSYEEGAAWLAQRPERVKVTVGAGDIDRLVPQVFLALKNAAL
ncbi:MAG TPA: UDP-N-acetylmuramate--L-alanine ligase [Cryomorphaceae bacterium]|nr:UDP-N-acetylmuramate--L-alanine ligase [Cryomorphaceae bacterium]